MPGDTWVGVQRRRQQRRPHVESGLGDQVAHHWEGEAPSDRRTITCADLHRGVVPFANALKELGVEKGTPVGIYMGMIPELLVPCSRAPGWARPTESSSAASPPTCSRSA